ncbi:MAG: hypothetical protein WBQ18_06060 [Solirubrobacteraceae bacterium]
MNSSDHTPSPRRIALALTLAIVALVAGIAAVVVAIELLRTALA